MLSIKMQFFKDQLEADFEKRLNALKEEQSKENESLRNELSEFKLSLDKKGEKRITANKQLLLLHYLGLLDILSFQVKERKYDIFYNIIDKNRQSVKNFFNYRGQEKTKEYEEIFNEENLHFVRKIFEDAGLTDKLEKVNSDILRLKL